MEKKFLNENEVAEVYGMKVRTLQQWRHLKRGPRYVKVGRSVRYAVSDVENFLNNGEVLPEKR